MCARPVPRMLDRRSTPGGVAERKGVGVMGCLFAIFAGAFPRLGTFIIWLARPQLFSEAFGGSWFWPILGIIFLPLTTLMYVLLWSTGHSIAGWDWVWLGLAAMLDLSHYAAAGTAGYQNRDQIPVYATRGVA